MNEEYMNEVRHLEELKKAIEKAAEAQKLAFFEEFMQPIINSCDVTSEAYRAAAAHFESYEKSLYSAMGAAFQRIDERIQDISKDMTHTATKTMENVVSPSGAGEVVNGINGALDLAGQGLASAVKSMNAGGGEIAEQNFNRTMQLVNAAANVALGGLKTVTKEAAEIVL